MSTEQVRDIIESAKDIVPAPTAIGVDLGKEPKIGSSGVEQLDVTGDMGDLDTVVRGTPSPESLSTHRYTIRGTPSYQRRILKTLQNLKYRQLGI